MGSPELRAASLRRLALASTSEGKQLASQRASRTSADAEGASAREASASERPWLPGDSSPLIGLTPDEERALRQMREEASAKDLL